PCVVGDTEPGPRRVGRQPQLRVNGFNHHNAAIGRGFAYDTNGSHRSDGTDNLAHASQMIIAAAAGATRHSTRQYRTAEFYFESRVGSALRLHQRLCKRKLQEAPS